MIDRDSVLALYRKYEQELFDVCGALRSQYHRMQAQGWEAGFGDCEGELLYMLTRELRPERVFEISPFTGWSTNYLLAALTANGHGTLHSFELLERWRGQPMEQVIRGNQHVRWDQSRLVVHLGDAREETQKVPGSIDLLFMDSCHEAWFAQWYLEMLVPRVSGAVFIQDVAFADGLEPSGEADVVWHWLAERKVRFQLAGLMEEDPRICEVRSALPERRLLRANSVWFQWPAGVAQNGAPVQWDTPSLDEQCRDAVTRGDRAEADRLLSRRVQSLLRSPHVGNRHRELIRIAQAYRSVGIFDEAERCFQRALGVSLAGDPQQRAKALGELVRPLVAHRQWRRAGVALAAAMLEPRARREMFHRAVAGVRARLGR